jgi:hypothetical protein
MRGTVCATEVGCGAMSGGSSLEHVNLNSETTVVIEKNDVAWTVWIRYCVKFGADPFRTKSLVIYAKKAVVV